MALLDICLTEKDTNVSQEEARGDVGVLTDINIDNKTNISDILTLSSEYVTIFIT